MLLGDARDSDRYLRVTWHPDSQTVVFSHWHGGVCAASTPIPLSEAGRLADLLAGVLRRPAAAGVPGVAAGVSSVAAGAAAGGSGVVGPGPVAGVAGTVRLTDTARMARLRRGSGAHESGE